MRRKEGVVNRHHFNKNAFFDFFLRRLSTRPTPGASCIPRRWRPKPPAHPERMHTTGSKANHVTHRHTHPDALHAAPVCTRYQTGHAGQIVPAAGRWKAWSVSETVQICTHSNMNDFQHKNVCKTIDTNTRTCYYIGNTRTCSTLPQNRSEKP